MTLRDFANLMDRKHTVRLKDKDGVTICECESDSVVIEKFGDYIVVGFAAINTFMNTAAISIRIKENLPFD